MRTPRPVSCNVSQCQPDQLGSGLIAGEVAAGLDDLAQLRIDALNRAGALSTGLGHGLGSGLSILQPRTLA
jgi:hypothetical protein